MYLMISFILFFLSGALTSEVKGSVTNDTLTVKANQNVSITFHHFQSQSVTVLCCLSLIT